MQHSRVVLTEVSASSRHFNIFSVAFPAYMLITVYTVAEAIRLYTEAIAGAPKDAELLCNRSIAHLSANNREEALQDAVDALKLRPDWAKAHYRYRNRQL